MVQAIETNSFSLANCVKACMLRVSCYRACAWFSCWSCLFANQFATKPTTMKMQCFPRVCRCNGMNMYMLYVNLMHYDMIMSPCLVCMIYIHIYTYIYIYKTVFHFTCSDVDENHECDSGAFYISEEGG